MVPLIASLTGARSNLSPEAANFAEALRRAGNVAPAAAPASVQTAGAAAPGGTAAGRKEKGSKAVDGLQALSATKTIPPDIAGTAADMAGLALASASYKKGMPPGWSKVPVESIGGLPLNDRKTGLNSTLYRNDTTGQVVLAFPSTGLSLKDLGTDLKAARGKEVPEQYRQAIALTRAAQQEYGDVSVTGHSLGGGLAMTASLATGAKGWAFSPLAPNEPTLREIGIDTVAANQANLNVFSSEGDFVSNPKRANDPNKTGLGGPLLGNVYYVPTSNIGALGGLLPFKADRFTAHYPVAQQEMLRSIAEGREPKRIGFGNVLGFFLRKRGDTG